MQRKTYLITGASSGIGAATAGLLQSQGHRVYGLARRVEAIAEGVESVGCDLTDEAAVRAVFAEFFEDGIRFDGIVNAAGVAYSSKIISGDAAEWREMWALNVHGLALCCQLVLPILEPDGIIVNVSSLSGQRVTPSGGFYAPTKFAVRALTESLRHELRAVQSRVRVGTISPGFVDTPILETYFRDEPSRHESVREAGMMLDAPVVAEAIASILAYPVGVEVGDVVLRSVAQTS